MLGNVIVAVGVFLAFLDLVLRHRADQRAVWMLHVGVILIGIGVLIGATGFIRV